MLAWNLRTNVRHNRARIYILNHEEIKLHRLAGREAFLQVPLDRYGGRDEATWPATMQYLLTTDDAARGASCEAVRGRE